MTPDSSAVFDLAGLIDLLRLGGPVVAVLVAMSVIALAIILLKCWQYASVRVGKRRFIAPALDQWHSGDRQGAIAALTDERNPIADTLGVAMRGVNAGANVTVVREEASRVGARHLSQMRSYFRPLEVIGSLAPLLGLLGTVMGMMEAFSAMATTEGRASASQLSGGIYEALTTTAAGLVIAIPFAAIAAWAEFRLRRLNSQMNERLLDILNATPAVETATGHRAELADREHPAPQSRDAYQPTRVAHAAG